MEQLSELGRVFNMKTPTWKIQLAPLNVPLERRLQTLAALAWILVPTVLAPLSWILSVVLFFTTTWGKYLVLAYGVWTYVDWKTPETGGRRSVWFRGLKWWHYLRDFYPVSLVKMAELPPENNYLFACYPHGVFSSGVFTAFATDALQFEDMFPGLKPYFCTLRLLFQLPVVREFGMALGSICVSAKSLKWLLGGPGGGRAAVVVVGGAEESFYNSPGVYEVILTRRKGFCRVALQTGCGIVPVFCFGEKDVFEVLDPKYNPKLGRIQKWMKKVTGLAPLIFNGRGIFNYSFGLLPRRAPLTVVVGKPILVTKVDNPTREEIDKLHMQFTENLVSLFNSEKHKYLKDPNTELVIL